MTTGRITRHLEGRPGITRYAEIAAVKPPPVHVGWSNLASQKSVRAIAAGVRTRRVWLATWGGVLCWDRSDGGTLWRYASEHGLAGNMAGCLCLDRDERPWVGHAPGGLTCLEGHAWRCYEYLRDEPVAALCAAETGIWVATGSAVYLVRGPDAPPEMRAAEHEATIDVCAMLADDAGVWLANPCGLFLLQPGSAPEPVEEHRIGACTALARDAAGHIWAATPSEVFRLDGRAWDGPYALPDDLQAYRITGLAAARGQTWVLTTMGIARIANGVWQPASLPNSTDGRQRTPRTIACSPQDAYAWVGTDEGLAVIWPEGNACRWDLDVLPAHEEDVLNNLGRAACAGPKSEVLVGTAGGLLVVSPDGSWRRVPNAGDVWQLCCDDRPGRSRDAELSPIGADRYLLAWPRGVARFDNSANVSFFQPQPPGVPQAIAVGQDGRLHVFTSQGLWCMSENGPQAIARGHEFQVHCLVQTADGVWWLGTSQGIFRSAGPHWELAAERPGPLEVAVYQFMAADGMLWAATAAGLWSYNGAGWQQRVVSRVTAMVMPSAEQTLWLACPEGVARYSPASGQFDLVCTPSDSGLAGRGVRALTQTRDHLIVVTANGISRCELGALRTGKHKS